MSDWLASSPEPETDPDGSRSRAMWGLAALAIIAILVVVIMVVFTSGGGHKSGDHGLPGPTDLSTLPLSSPSPTPTQVSTGASTTAPPSTSPAPTSTANPCPSAAACTVPGDAGQLIAAVNNFRTAHGRPAVPGTVTPKAQQCALAQGEGPNCAPSYSWEPVPTQDAAKVISLIAGRGDGVQWLLDPGMTSFNVGWAYAPGTGYECAILKLR